MESCLLAVDLFPPVSGLIVSNVKMFDSSKAIHETDVQKPAAEVYKIPETISVLIDRIHIDANLLLTRVNCHYGDN